LSTGFFICASEQIRIIFCEKKFLIEFCQLLGGKVDLGRERWEISAQTVDTDVLIIPRVHSLDSIFLF
jgi:hypothetical protein